MKKIEIEMLLYTLIKNFIEGQGNMLNPFDIILFYKVVWWFDGQNIGVKPICKETNVQSPLPTYITWRMCIHIYTLYMCVNV
jgi:hypothetical protein